MELAIVTTTVESEADASALARKIVRSSLAACVQVWPIRSTYRWKGKLEEASEHMLVAKTRLALVDRLVGFIKANHSYEVPEIIATPVLTGHRDYTDWIAAETELDRDA